MAKVSETQTGWKDEGKAVELTDENLLSMFDGAGFDEARVEENAVSDETFTVELPRYVLYKHRSVNRPVRTICDLKAALDEEGGAEYLAKLACDQAKIKASKTIGALCDGGVDTFLVSLQRSILEPGRGEGGTRFSPEKYKMLAKKRKNGEQLSDEEAAYFDDADNKRRFQQHIADILALQG